MGRLSEIEEIAAGTIPYFSNLKMLVRGRPRFVDPQLDSGILRFATKRGFNCTAVIANNQVGLAEDVFKDSHRVTLVARPRELNLNTLIRIGDSAEIGEMHIVSDLIGTTAFETRDPLILSYSADIAQNRVPVVSLVGTPCIIYREEQEESPHFFCESWYQIVPGDALLLSPTPEILPSLTSYEVREALYLSQRDGDTNLGEPSVVYRYRIALKTKTGLLPFKPKFEMRFFLKAQPLFIRDTSGVSDVEIPQDMGPCLLDAFFGGLLYTSKTETRIGLRTWDSFSQQLNVPPDGQPWQMVPPNHMILERPISSDSFLFWQRITGNFQFQKKGFFLAELSDEGRFSMTSDLLVPPWPSDKERGWVIPVLARSAARCVIQFEPQPPQIFEIPSNSLYFIRPRIFTEPHKMLLHFSDDYVTGETKTLNFSKTFVDIKEQVSLKINGVLIGPLRFDTDHATTMAKIVMAINDKKGQTSVRASLEDTLVIKLEGKYPNFTVSNFISEFNAPLMTLSMSRTIHFEREFVSSEEQVRFKVNDITIGPVAFAGSHAATVAAIIQAFEDQKTVTGVSASLDDESTILLSSLVEFSLSEVLSIDGPPMSVTEVFTPFNEKYISFRLNGQAIGATSTPINTTSLAALVDAIQAGETKRVNLLSLARYGNMVTVTTATPHRFQHNQSILINIPSQPSLKGTFKIRDIPTATSFIYEHIGDNLSLDSQRAIINGSEVIYFIGVTSPARAEVVDNRSLLLVGSHEGTPIVFEDLSISYADEEEGLRISAVPILPQNPPIERIVLSFEGSPNSRIEMRDWQYDGPTVDSFSYYLLGTGDVFGTNKWAAGGICLKPLFFNLKVLQARYSDGIAQYNSGYIYV